MDNTVKVTAEKVYRRKLFTRIVKMALLVLLLFFSILYLILYVINSNGYFTIKLDRNLKSERHILLSSDSEFSVSIFSFLSVVLHPPRHFRHLAKTLPFQSLSAFFKHFSDKRKNLSGKCCYS